MTPEERILNGSQPVAQISDDDLEFLIAREFPNDTESVQISLNKIVSDSKAGQNRIASAVLKLSSGKKEKLEHFVTKANEDFRDIVCYAEYPKTMSFDFGERTEEENKKDYLEDWQEYSKWKNKK